MCGFDSNLQRAFDEAVSAVAVSAWEAIESARLARMSAMAKDLADVQERRQKSQLVFEKELELRKQLAEKVLKE